MCIIQNHCRWWLQPWNKKILPPWEKSYDQPRQHIKKQRHYLPTKVHLVKAMVFPVVTYRLWYWRRLLSPLDCMEIQPVHLKGNQPWIFIRSTDAEAEAPIHWPHDVKSSFIGKDPDAVKDWGQEEKRVAEDETVGWHHRLKMSLSKLRKIVKDRKA